MPGVVERAPRRHGPMRQGLSPAGSAARSRLSAQCAVGERSVIPHAMPAAIGDVGGDGVDPVERIEEANGRTGGGSGGVVISSMPLLVRRMLSAASGGRVT